MLCLPKSCSGGCGEKDTLDKLSSAAMLVGGVMAIAYYGWKLAEKIGCECRKHDSFRCACETNTAHSNAYSHVSENDCLSHDAKDYYGKCGCFDNPDGCADDLPEEETM